MKESFGPDTSLDIPGLGARLGGRPGDRLGAGARKPGRLGQRRGRRLARRRGAAGGRVRRLGAARPRADAADALLPLPRLLGRQRGDLLHVRVALRGRVLLRAAAADGDRLRPARGGAAAAALDRHLHHGRPDRRSARRPDRRAAVDGQRAAPAGGGNGLAGVDRRARPCLLRVARAVHRRRRRRFDGDSGSAELGCRLGGDRGDRQGGGRQQHDARARRRLRNRARRRRLRRGGELRLRCRVHRRIRPGDRRRGRPVARRGDRRPGAARPSPGDQEPRRPRSSRLRSGSGGAEPCRAPTTDASSFATRSSPIG